MSLLNKFIISFEFLIICSVLSSVDSWCSESPFIKSIQCLKTGVAISWNSPESVCFLSCVKFQIISATATLCVNVE